MKTNLKEFLNQKLAQYNHINFVESDPVAIPHQFLIKQDIEIAGLFAAVFAWGNRQTILNKSRILMKMMDSAPYDFLKNHQPKDLKIFRGFCHRTFNEIDLLYFIRFLTFHFRRNDSLEQAFFPKKILTVETALNHFRNYFFSLPEAPARTRKHIPAPENNSSCKRLNMYLRWMVRNDQQGVDFGIWKSIKPSELICPLDLHVIRVARQLGLLERKQADWQAALELTAKLRLLDYRDPVKYDLALFGIGVNHDIVPDLT